MKILTEEKIVKVAEKIEDIEAEGLLALMGKCVTLFCANYIYAGKLVGVNKTCVKLENAHLVFETGEFGSLKYKDAQRLANVFYIQTSAVESFGVLKDL